jgi:protein-disulfide isomerase
MHMRAVVFAVLVICPLAGCGPDPALEEIQSDQREIFFRLGALDNAVKVAASGGGGGAAPSPNVVENDKVYPDKVYTIPIGNSPVKGPEDARVTIVEFSDFQCPPCGESHELMENVLKAYPKDVKLVYKNFPLTSIHNNAMAAAKAATAAGKQGKFWEMHDVLFENQSALDTDKLTEYAGKVGLNVPRWVSDFSSQEVSQMVSREMQDGRTADVDATPTFFINGKRMTQRSFDDFKRAIDEALKAPAKKG